MSKTMDEDIKRWTAKRKNALMLTSSRAKRWFQKPAVSTTCRRGSRAMMVEDAKWSMENALRVMTH